jgi:hypothetical protein
MSDEHPNITNFDWRLEHVSVIEVIKEDDEEVTENDNEIILKDGAPVILVGFAKYNDILLDMPLPNPCAIYLSLANNAAKNAAKLTNKLDEILAKSPLDDGYKEDYKEKKIKSLPSEFTSDLFDACQELIACVIFSYTAIEVFANGSIPDDFDFVKERSDKRNTEIYSKEQIERFVNLDTKLHEILPDIRSVKSPKGTKKWENYIWLKELRDRFVHLKSIDWETCDPESADEFVWSHLLSDKVKVMKAPFISTILIEHYYKKDKPRWLEKWTLQSKNA